MSALAHPRVGGVRGVAEVTTFVQDIDYDAKGQREKIVYGNGATTEYAYDPLTFRLTHMVTTRGGDADLLQDLRYTFDPAGNINVYSCELLFPFIAGSATFPHSYPENDPQHGVNVDYRTFPGGTWAPYDMGATLGHEIGHVTAQHGNQRISQQQLFNAGLAIGAVAVLATLAVVAWWVLRHGVRPLATMTTTAASARNMAFRKRRTPSVTATISESCSPARG